MTKIDNNFTGDATTMPEYKEMQEIRIPEGYLRYKEWGDNFGKFLEYREIWVDEDKRRKGYGTKLMKMLFKLAKKQGVEVYVRASTDGKSDVLGKFITFLGYKPTYDIVSENEYDASWLGNYIKFHSEIEKYRNETLGLTFKYVANKKIQ